MPSVPHRRARREPNLRDRWKAAVQRTRTLRAGTRLFLVATLAEHMDARGIACHPRDRLAEHAGVSERQVTNYIKAAREAGWLIVVTPGYRTMTAKYQATFPDGKREILCSPIPVEKAGTLLAPFVREVSFPLSGRKAGNLVFPPLVPIGTRTGVAAVCAHNRTAASAALRRCVSSSMSATTHSRQATYGLSPLAVMDGASRRSSR